MPTKKPRVMLSVPEDLNDLLQEVADHIGIVKTKLIIEILQETKPALETMRDAFNEIKTSSAPIEVVKRFGVQTLADVNKLAADFSADVASFHKDNNKND